MRVVGIDPSLSGFAVCSLTNEWEWKTKSTGDEVEQRIRRYRQLANFCCEAVFEPQPEPKAHVYIEGYSFGSMASTQLRLAELRGVLYERLIVGAELVEVSPGTLKMFACGKGNGDKVAVATSLAHRYGREFKSDNAADAFALMKLGLCVEGIEEPQTVQQRKAVETVKKLKAAA